MGLETEVLRSETNVAWAGPGVRLHGIPQAPGTLQLQHAQQTHGDRSTRGTRTKAVQKTAMRIQAMRFILRRD
jgi:hypothetical protein